MCNISNKNRPPNKLAKYQYFYTRVFISLLHLEDSLKIYLSFFPKGIGSLCLRGYYKHPRLTICLLVLTVGEVCNISNKNQLPNTSILYLLIYTKDLSHLLRFQRKLAVSVAEVPRNIHSLPFFYWFWEWVSCLILQINTSFLISRQKNLYFHLRDLPPFPKVIDGFHQRGI